MKRFVFQLATVVVTAGVMTLPSMAQTSDNNDFITKAMQSNYAEVRLGCLASQKAQNPQVKDFAQMMVTDHSQALKRMHEMTNASATGTDATGNLNNMNMSENAGNADEICQSIAQNQGAQGDQSLGQIQLSAKDQTLYNRLKQLSGNSFDREYVNAMVDDHKQDVREFQQVAGVTGNDNTGNERQKPDSGMSDSNDEAQKIARELLPTLQKHLQAAETLQKQLQH